MLGARLLKRRWQRGALVLGGVGVGVLVGLTRPYLGVHYPLDVLAGWVGGLLCVAVAYGLTAPHEAEQSETTAELPPHETVASAETSPRRQDC